MQTDSKGGSCSEYDSVIQDECSSTSAVPLHCNRPTVTKISVTFAAAGGGFHRCRYLSPRVNNRHVNRAVRRHVEERREELIYSVTCCRNNSHRFCKLPLGGSRPTDTPAKSGNPQKTTDPETVVVKYMTDKYMKAILPEISLEATFSALWKKSLITHAAYISKVLTSYFSSVNVYVHALWCRCLVSSVQHVFLPKHNFLIATCGT